MVLFAVAYGFYLWRVVDPRLLYHGAGELSNFPVFYKGWSFFRPFFLYPGGLVEYAAAFLAQCLYHPWLGPLILTVHAVGTGLVLRSICARLHVPGKDFWAFLPAIGFLVTYHRYTYHFGTSLAFSVVLVFLWLYLLVLKTRRREVWFWVMSPLVYWTVAGGYVLFALVCVLEAVLYRSRWRLGLLYGCFAVLLVYTIGVVLVGDRALDAYTDHLPISWKILAYPERRSMIEAIWAVYLLLPILTLVFGMGQRITRLAPAGRVQEIEMQGSRPGRASHTRRAGARKRTASVASRGIRALATGGLTAVVAQWALLIGVAVVSVILSFQAERKAVFEVDYCACRREWDRVLSIADEYPRHPFIVHTATRALYHCRRLETDLFRYAQHPSLPMLGSREFIYEHWRRFDLYLDLGHVNHAECALVEALESVGERPLILQRLALVNMAQGDLATARVYLGALSRTLFEGGWARRYLEQLAADPNLSGDEEVQRLRALTPTKDTAGIHFSFPATLASLLEHNPANRMAFEYAMAVDLLLKRPGFVVENIGRLRDLDYPRIPPLYEQAILTYMLAERKDADLHGYRFTKVSVDQANRFVTTINRYAPDMELARRELAGDYGDTYLYYHAFGESGGQR
ncbi:MAG: hypothetical protein JW993_20775 [Sedimentisphaerales bacterium]|nr:hypothetical protein [Sedimentisphaerales bacterium]